MATRSYIRVITPDGPKDYYHHYDGYPDGVGLELLYLTFKSSHNLEKFMTILEEIKDHNNQPAYDSSVIINWNKPEDYRYTVEQVTHADYKLLKVTCEKYDWIDDVEDDCMHKVKTSEFQIKIDGGIW